MTFSFIRRAYTIVYHCFAEVMGISPRVVRRHRDTFDNMLGLFRGRVYYNLINWYRLVRLFPGYHYNSRFMESMMGLKEPLILDDEGAAGLAAALAGRTARPGPAVAPLDLELPAHPQHRRPFPTTLSRHYDHWSPIDFDGMQPHELMALHAKMEEALLWNWKAPIINDFYVMIFYGVLKNVCRLVRRRDRLTAERPDLRRRAASKATSRRRC